MLEFKDATIKVGEWILPMRLSFIARDGEVTCVMGLEDSGKTTLIRTLMGFLPVNEGFVSYLPQQIQLLAHQLRVPEPEEPEAEEFAVWNDLMSAANEESTPEPLNAEEIVMLAEQTLKEAADKPIVIADEPTAFLTPELTMRMMELLRKQAEAGKTVLVTTRKPQVADYADQVIRLDN